MSQVRRHLLLMVHALMLLMLCAGHIIGQTPADQFLKQRMTVKIDDATFITVLATISAKQQIPIGLELSTISYDANRQSINLSNETLERTLDLVCELWPAYKWEIADGVINFVPLHARDLLLEQLLATQIEHFAPTRELSRFEVRDAILDLPEVKRFFDANDFSVFRLGPPTRGSDEVGKVELSISSTSLKGLLNKIIKVSAGRFWTLSRRPVGGKEIQITL